MPIHKLPQEVVNQIAAGEVVERPAHLLKELLENSIDAGATRIEVEVEQGGRWIRVRDNGVGIAASDLALALEPHATSKIESAEDLWALDSFGFRGEALASIAAISKLSMTSRQESDPLAHRIVCEFGKCQEIETVGGETGTEVLVEDLFENVPARLKFLKSDAAEVTQIKLVLKALAMANPYVELRFRQRGNLVYYWPAQVSRRERVAQVLELAEMYDVQGSRDNIQVEVVFAPPHQTVGNSRQIWIFVQGRWVQDRRLQAAVTEAYRNLLMHGEFPVAVVWFNCDPQDIDVNIHPTKSQVKFRDDQNAFRSVHHTLRQGLESAPWLENLLQATRPAQEVGSKLTTSDGWAEPTRRPTAKKPNSNQFILREPGRSYSNFSFQEDSFSKTQYQQKDMTMIDALRNLAPDFEVSDVDLSQATVENRDERQLPVAAEVVDRSSHDKGPALLSDEEKPRTSWANLQVLGQADQTYIIAQSAKAVLFIDQHAAHERVVFERLMLAWQTGKVETQDLLLPLTFESEDESVEILMGLAPAFEQMGISLSRGGPNLISIHSVPAIIKESGLIEVFHKLVGEVARQGDSFAMERAIGDIFATMACHSVIRAGQALSDVEMRSLLQQMDEFPLSSFCPHGRPVFVEYPFIELQRDFGRLG